MEKVVLVAIILVIGLLGLLAFAWLSQPELKEPGEPCTSNETCRITNRCIDGFCAFSEKGQPCESNAHCADDLKCKEKNGKYVCVVEEAYCTFAKQWMWHSLLISVLIIGGIAWAVSQGMNLGNILATKQSLGKGGAALSIPGIALVCLIIFLIGLTC